MLREIEVFVALARCCFVANGADNLRADVGDCLSLSDTAPPLQKNIFTHHSSLLPDSGLRTLDSLFSRRRLPTHD